MKQNKKASPRKWQAIMIVLLFSLSMVAPSFRVAAQDDLQAQLSQLIDLSTNPNAANVQMLGATTGDRLSGSGAADSFAATSYPRAHAVVTGDFNNDGNRDIVAGAANFDFTPQGGTARADAGAVYVLLGRPAFGSPSIVDTNTTALSQPDLRVFGAAAGDNLGFAVAARDVNGDSIDDLIIGAPGTDFGTTPNDRADVGSVYIIFGAATNFAPRTIDLAVANSANVQIIGAAAGDRFGSALAAGDVNGAISPVADLAIGAPGSRGPTPATAARDNGGAIYAVFGGTNLANTTATTKVIDIGQSTVGVVTIFGRAGSRLGSSVAIGDVNAGNAGDILGGAPTADRPQEGGDLLQAGAVFGIFGGTNLNVVPPATQRVFDINATQQNLSIYGEGTGDHLCASVAAVSVSQDATADIIIGAPNADGPANGRSNSGEAYVIRGGTGLNPTGQNTEMRINVSVGVVDLVIYGAAANDHTGAAVAGGVVNNQNNTDTIADVIVGSPGALSNRGSASILFGGANLFVFGVRDLALGQDDIRILGQANGDEFGWALATGDIDENLAGDLVVGAPFFDVPISQGNTRQDAGIVYAFLAAATTIPPVNDPPTVVVTAPNGGQVIQGGTNFQITWTAADPDGDATLQAFEIRLSTDGGATFNQIIASNLTGTARSFTWAVPTGVNTATARIRVVAFDNAGAQGQDDSNTNFTITDAGVTVTLIAPNGGENLRAGDNFLIRWAVGTGFENLVRGFDIFYTTDNGGTFTPITPVNPTQPALVGDVREFNWTVPNICSTNVRVVITATSTSNATSSDSSNAPFSISERGPQLDPAELYFSKGNKRINLWILPNTQPLFLAGVTLQISNDEAGTTFVTVPDVVIKSGGNKIESLGRIGDLRIGQFFPDGATRVLRITNPTCGVTTLRVRRVGQDIVPATANATGLQPQSLQNWQ
jgi:FG-GAP repeat